MKIISKIKEQWKKIVFLEKSPESGEIILNQRRVFTLPNKAGLMFALVLIILLIMSINYNLNLGLALTYLLIGVWVISIFYSFRNLAYLHLSAHRPAPIFAGDAAQFIVHIKNPKSVARYAISIGFHSNMGSEQVIDIQANNQVTVTINQQSKQRGYMPIQRLRLQTSFPLGIISAWSTWLPYLQVLVFPTPETNPPPLPFSTGSSNEDMTSLGNEDFSGVRNYREGDPLKHLSWKHIARVDLDAGGTFISKQFSGSSIGEIHLDFAALPAQLDIELRLSRMTSWVLEANAKGLSYQLTMPSRSYRAAASEAHKIACLTALALYPNAPTDYQSSP